MRDPNLPVTKEEAARRAALSSPARLELVSLFGEDEQLSVSDMAARTGRPATSIYHHLRVLESAGVIHSVGTRPKGKRFETIYEVTQSMLALAHDPEDPQSHVEVTRAIKAMFRTASRDFVAAIDRDDLVQEGPARNIFTVHFSGRLSAGALSRLNDWLSEFERRLADESDNRPEPAPDDQFLSFTIALAPIRGRSASPSPEQGESS